tara:strand:+ start:222 stop:461 length:240 start_codon:yes stop_codon:yes gene_type:complete
MVDYRDFAIELTEDMGFSTEQMLVAALKWMSQDDVKGMLEANEYPMSCEEDDEVEDFAPPESLSALMDEADRVFGSNAI